MPDPDRVSEPHSPDEGCSQIVTLGLALRSMTLSRNSEGWTGSGVQARDDTLYVSVRDAAEPDVELHINRGAWTQFIRAVAAGEFGLDAQRRAA